MPNPLFPISLQSSAKIDPAFLAAINAGEIPKVAPAKKANVWQKLWGNNADEINMAYAMQLAKELQSDKSSASNMTTAHELEQQANDAFMSRLSDKALLEQGFRPDQFDAMRSLMLKERQAAADTASSRAAMAGVGAKYAEPQAIAVTDENKARAQAMGIKARELADTSVNRVFADNALAGNSVKASDLDLIGAKNKNALDRTRLKLAGPQVTLADLQQQLLKYNKDFAGSLAGWDLAKEATFAIPDNTTLINEPLQIRATGSSISTELGPQPVTSRRSDGTPATFGEAPVLRTVTPARITKGRNLSLGPVRKRKRSAPITSQPRPVDTEVITPEQLLQLLTPITPSTQLIPTYPRPF